MMHGLTDIKLKSMSVFAKIFCCVLNSDFVGRAGSVNLSKYNSYYNLYIDLCPLLVIK